MLETGRTSAISQQIIGYAPDGTIVNYANPDVREAHQPMGGDRVRLRQGDLILPRRDARYIGDDHARHRRQSSGHTVMCVDANRGGIVGMTKEHLSIMLGLKVPFFVIVTKIDGLSEEIESAIATRRCSRASQTSGVHKTPILVRNEQDVMTTVKNIAGGVIYHPIFQASCVTGEGLGFMMLLNRHSISENAQASGRKRDARAPR